MAEAFIYDHVRTPRGRGKKDGALHEVSTVKLAAGVLGAVRDRNDLDAALVDDVILGCVDPVGEAGGDIARAAVFAAGFPTFGAGHPDQPLLRLGARRGQPRQRGDRRAASTTWSSPAASNR